MRRKIVTLGGGTGHYALLTGLKEYPVVITAIPTSYDSGGNTGELRDQYGALPSGDARRCVAALLDSDVFRKVLGYRIVDGPLKGQSLGNLLIMACDDMWGRGKGIEQIASILKLAGRVIPISIDDAHLHAELDDGTLLTSEAEIDTRDPKDTRQIVRVSLAPRAFISRDAYDAILEADLIVFAPGDLYTSTIATLLTEGCKEAIAESSGKLVCVSNIMTKPAETRGYTLRKFVNTFFEYGIGREKFDAVIVNNFTPQNGVAEKYRDDASAPILLDEESRNGLKDRVARFVECDLVSRESLKEKLIRHDSVNLARALMEL
jgi:uncharacterized cofD-like protein